jgi:hypothetical protein
MIQVRGAIQSYPVPGNPRPKQTIACASINKGVIFAGGALKITINEEL